MKEKIEYLLNMSAAQSRSAVLGNGPGDDVTGQTAEEDVPESETPSADTPQAAFDVRNSWPAGKKMISKMDRELLARIDEEIENNLQDSEYTIDMLRTKLGISRSGLYKKLIYLTGRSPLEYIRIKRLQKGRDMLESGETSVSQIAWSVGFSPKQFSKYFKDEYGCLPSGFIHFLTE
ncbi:MAG: helix-turn-helix transcriptional regulator [Bacteroidales bacterium]|nr:helix-turn-helix transcriptional regulator [Bacteroidales bacterium]